MAEVLHSELRQLRCQNLRLQKELAEKTGEIASLKSQLQSQCSNSLVKYYERRLAEQEIEKEKTKSLLESAEQRARRKMEQEVLRLWKLVEEGDFKLKQLESRLVSSKALDKSISLQESTIELSVEHERLRSRIAGGEVRDRQTVTLVDLAEIDRQIRELEGLQDEFIRENQELKAKLEKMPSPISYSYILKALPSLRRELQHLVKAALSVKTDLEPSMRLLLNTDSSFIDSSEGSDEVKILSELDLLRSCISDLKSALTVIIASTNGRNVLI